MEAFVTASVTYLNEILEMNGGELGIVFALVHIATIPGARIGYYLSIKKDPIFSLKVCHLIFCVSILTCAFVLSGPEKKNLSYIWFVLFGISLGWAYPTEDLIFSMCLPKGQEAELSGFFLYCTQIIAWLPPLIFTSINESGVHMKFAVMSMSIFFFIAWIFLMLMDPWTSVLTSAKTNRMIPDRAEREKQEQEEAIR